MGRVSARLHTVVEETLIVVRAAPEHAVGVLAIAREVASDGTTYVFEEDVSDEALQRYWLDPDALTYVAVRCDEVLGMYVLRPNHPGRGSHVANASYAVGGHARGHGIGRRLAEHSLEVGREAGYRSMQFNLVVATNTRAITLWEALGFERVGTLPSAFRHPQQGYVDAYVMVRSLLLGDDRPVG